jgi:sialic acid synthase SpsE
MLSLKGRYGCDVGFSDHTVGYMAAVQAVSMGAKIVEKHFTLDHKLPGPDHWFSVDPDELKELVREIRVAESRLGCPEIKSALSEEAWKNENRIGVVVSRDMRAGEFLTKNDVLYKKPLHGIKPVDIEKYFGLQINKSIKKYSPIKSEDFFI